MPTKPMTMRMDLDLWRRLIHHAPLQRRSVGNLLQYLVATGLDRLDDEEAIREVVRNNLQLLMDLKPGEAQRILQRQLIVIARRAGIRAGKKRLPPLPPSMAKARKRLRKPRKI